MLRAVGNSGGSKGVANGYCPLDGNVLVPLANIPPAALERMVNVADQTARYALTPATAQNGDTISQNDTTPPSLWLVKDDTHLGDASGYQAYSAATAVALVNGAALNTPASGVTDNLTTTTTTDAITDLDYVDETLAAGGKRKILWTAVKSYLAGTNVLLVTASHLVTPAANVILADATSGAIPIQFPAASTITKMAFTVKRLNAGANAVTLLPDGTETIDGAASMIIATQYTAITVVSDGTNLFVI